MSNDNKKDISPEEVAKNTEAEETEISEEETEASEETPKETSAEPTIEETIGEQPDDRVPLKTFLEIKNEKKALERELKRVRSSAQQGATKSEIRADLQAIADKYDVDVDFLTELSSVIYAQAKGDAEEVIKPVLEKEAKERVDKALTENINKALEVMPEYEGVVNKDVLKSLARLPENKNKTFQQLIEETYSKTVTGKRTMETSTPRGGKELVYDESRINDPEYFSEVMASPELKKKYNDSLVDRLKL